MKSTTPIDPQLQTLLDEFRPVPPRNPLAAARGRAQFLARVAALEEHRSAGRPSPLHWQMGFAAKAVVSIAVAVGLLSSGVATVYASRDDLPNQPLYPVKLVVEDVRLGASTDPQTRFDLLMEMSQHRLDEMAALDQAGEQIPASLVQRLGRQNRQALQVAAGMDDRQMNDALLRFRTRLEKQAVAMGQLQAQMPSNADPAIGQTRTMLEAQLSLVETGLTDPRDFRQTVQAGTDVMPGPAPAPIADTPSVATAGRADDIAPTVTPEEAPPPSSPEPTEPGGKQEVQDGGNNATATSVLTATPKPNGKGPTKTHKPKPSPGPGHGPGRGPKYARSANP
jgi:hypothetical protein